MNTNQLPPELVEKIKNEQKIYWNGIECISVEQCAQIAVDYAFDTFIPLNQQLKELRNQRDELLGLVRHFKALADTGLISLTEFDLNLINTAIEEYGK